MYRTRVRHAGHPLEQRAPRDTIGPALIVASAIGAAISLSGLVWTYLRTAYFAAPGPAPGSQLTIPHWPLFGVLAAVCIALNIGMRIAMPPPRTLLIPWLGERVYLCDITIIVAIVLSIICYIGPIWVALAHAPSDLIARRPLSIPTGVQFGCAISRCIFTVLLAAYLTGGIYGVWWGWRHGIIA